MRALKQQLKHNLVLFLFSTVLSAIPAMAATDIEAQEGFAKARAKTTQHIKTMPIIVRSFAAFFTAFSLAAIAPGLNRRCL